VPQIAHSPELSQWLVIDFTLRTPAGGFPEADDLRMPAARATMKQSIFARADV